MNTQKANLEKGQAIVLIALGIVALLAFVSLAVDGGMVLYDRRSAQNAADAAALAGAFQIAKDPWATSTLSSRVNAAALARANENNYGPDSGKVVTITYPATDVHLATDDKRIADCTNPAIVECNYVEVQITSTVNTNFLHFIFGDPVRNTVTAVGHAVPPQKTNVFEGAGLIALAPTGCGVVTLGGNNIATLIGGGIFVNSNSDQHNCNGLEGPSGAYQVYSPSVTVVGGISDSVGVGTNLILPPGVAPESPAPEEALEYPPGIDMGGKPECDTNATLHTVTSADSGANPDGTMTKTNPDGSTFNYKYIMSPGTWSDWSHFPADKNIWFEPGIYCFVSQNNKNLSFNNGEHIGGEDVLFYITGTNPCNFTWNGGAVIKLSGYRLGSEDPHNGILIFVDYGANYSPVSAGPMQFNGTSDSYMIGTVYGPTCSAKLNGTGGNFYQGQMIAYDITLTGGNTFNMTYVPNNNHKEQGAALEDLSQ